MSDPRIKSIETLTAALQGHVEIHVWRGTPSPWMHSVAVTPGSVVDEMPAHFTPEFVAQTGVHYGGVMTANEIEGRLQDFSYPQEVL